MHKNQRLATFPICSFHPLLALGLVSVCLALRIQFLLYANGQSRSIRWACRVVGNSVLDALLQFSGIDATAQEFGLKQFIQFAK